MSNDLFDNITDKLRIEEERLSNELKRLQQNTKEVSTDLKRIQDVRKAMNGGRGSGATPRKPAATAADVSCIVKDILQSSEAVDDSLLREQIAEEVVKSGKSRMGLSLRIKEVLASSEFTESQTGWQLALLRDN